MPAQACVFFYGTIMNPDVLREEFGARPGAVVAARLSGFKINIRPRVNLIRADRACVYGALVALAPEEIERLYATLKERYGVSYHPHAVLVETLDGSFRPALCYLASRMHDEDAQPAYVRQLAAAVRGLGLPEWYARDIEAFAAGRI